MHFFLESISSGIFYFIRVGVCAVVVLPFFAYAESPQVQPLRIALHAAPHEVSPIVLTLSSDDPLLAESSPVLIPSDDGEMPPRQNPWLWVDVTGTFTGYISQLNMDEMNQPLAGAPILAAPDLDSPSLIRAKSVADDLKMVSSEGPFWKVRFRATLPLFLDFDAAPIKESEAEFLLYPADSHSAQLISPSDSASIEEPPPPIRVEDSRKELFTEPVDVAPIQASPVVRILQGQLVSARDAGIRRATFQHVIISPAGTPLAYADLQFFRGGSLSSIIGKDGTFTGAVVLQSNARGTLPVMQVRTFRTP
jgi:hypothetical protein